MNINTLITIKEALEERVQMQKKTKLRKYDREQNQTPGQEVSNCKECQTMRMLDAESCWNRNMFKIRDVQYKELQAKQVYYDVILEQVEPVDLEVIATDYGRLESELCNYLLHKQVLLSRTGLVYPNPEYASKGFTSTSWREGQKGPSAAGGSVDDCEKAASIGTVYIRWTQKGRLYLYELFKSEGWLPLIEQEEAEDYCPF